MPPSHEVTNLLDTMDEHTEALNRLYDDMGASLEGSVERILGPRVDSLSRDEVMVAVSHPSRSVIVHTVTEGAGRSTAALGGALAVELAGALLRAAARYPGRLGADAWRVQAAAELLAPFGEDAF